jgi:hypothetical protein
MDFSMLKRAFALLSLILCVGCASVPKDVSKSAPESKTKAKARVEVARKKPVIDFAALPLEPRGFALPATKVAFAANFKPGQVFETETVEFERSIAKTRIEILKVEDGFPRAVRINHLSSYKLSESIQKNSLSGVVSVDNRGLLAVSKIKSRGNIYLGKGKGRLQRDLIKLSRGYMTPGYYYPMEEKEYKVGDAWGQGEVDQGQKWSRKSQSKLVAVVNVTGVKVAKIQSETVITYSDGSVKKDKSTVYWDVAGGFRTYQRTEPGKDWWQKVTASKTTVVK